ncbi:unannotated protein [freshwater metagenome]|uniref:Unannotated protein n=1 Tax=freshwater metagenome TaxID=449393 RepID=A0A6J7G7Y8_9ZZZZ
MTSTVATVASGYCSRTPKSFPSSVPWSAMSVPACCAAMPAPPKTANQTRLTALGTSRTPVTNCRMVRPRLIRAMNRPTNGVQLIHQAQ